MFYPLLYSQCVVFMTYVTGSVIKYMWLHWIKYQSNHHMLRVRRTTILVYNPTLARILRNQFTALHSALNLLTTGKRFLVSTWQYPCQHSHHSMSTATPPPPLSAGKNGFGGLKTWWSGSTSKTIWRGNELCFFTMLVRRLTTSLKLCQTLGRKTPRMVALEPPELRQSHGTGQQTRRRHRAAARSVVGEPYIRTTDARTQRQSMKWSFDTHANWQDVLFLWR